MIHSLATADFSFPLLKHDKALALISLLGLEAVDIGLFEGRSHLWPSREFENVPKSGKALRNRLDDVGLKCADVFLQMDPDFTLYAINHPEPGRREKARDWFLKTLDYAGELSAPHVTALPGVLYDEEPPSQSLGRACEELAWRVEQAGERDLIFGTEAHVGSLAPDPACAEQLVKSVPGLTLTLDYTHFTRIGIPDTEVEPLVAHASHFHVRGARKGRLQASFKENTIDYIRVLEVMAATGYAGCLAIEYVWIDWEHCNEVDNLSETIQFRDYLRSIQLT